MIKRISSIIIALLFLIPVSLVFGQEAAEISDLIDSREEISAHDISSIKDKVIVADTLKGWSLSWVNSLNGAQASYNNWSQGGVNTVSVTASTAFGAQYRKDRFAYALDTNFKYGKAHLEGEGTRKTDDLIAINNKFSYLFDNPNWSGFANINFNTQFDEGYDYDEDPKELISKFFAPAYFTQIAGVAYSPTDYFFAEGGLALKETIVSDTSLSQRYGVNKGEKFRFEPGYSVALGFEKEIFSNVRLISSVETFTNLQRHIDNTDINFSNELIGKVNDVLNMSLQFVMIYDSDFSREVQVKQVLSAGISYSIF